MYPTVQSPHYSSTPVRQYVNTSIRRLLQDPTTPRSSVRRPIGTSPEFPAACDMSGAGIRTRSSVTCAPSPPPWRRDHSAGRTSTRRRRRRPSVPAGQVGGPNRMWEDGRVRETGPLRPVVPREVTADGLSGVGRRILAMTALAALLVFVPRSHDAFARPKTVLVAAGIERVLSVFASPQVLLAGDRQRNSRSGSFRVVGWLTVCLASAYLIATVAGEDARHSLWGEQLQYQGLVPFLLVLAAFRLATAWTRRRQRLSGVLHRSPHRLGSDLAVHDRPDPAS